MTTPTRVTGMGTAEAVSPGKLVRVTVDARGRILHVDLAEGVAGMDAGELGRLIMRTAATACRRAAARGADGLASPGDGDDTDPSTSEWRAAIGAIDDMRGHETQQN